MSMKGIMHVIIDGRIALVKIQLEKFRDLKHANKLGL